MKSVFVAVVPWVLAGCASEPSLTARAPVAPIVLHVSVQSTFGEPAREACREHIADALMRHGYAAASEGLPVDVVVSLTPELTPSSVVDHDYGQLPKYDGPLTPPPPPSLVAHLSATIDRKSSREVRVAGAGDAPCAQAGERLAEALGARGARR